jgi:hypothetical protein
LPTIFLPSTFATSTKKNEPNKGNIQKDEFATSSSGIFGFFFWKSQF